MLLFATSLLYLSLGDGAPCLTQFGSDILWQKHRFQLEEFIQSPRHLENSISKQNVPESIQKKVNKPIKSPFTQAGEAMDWYVYQRTEGEPLDFSRYTQALEEVEANSLRGTGPISDWQALGPGNVGGRTRGFLVHPSNANTMWAAGVAGGVWKTTNGGNTWTPTDDFMANMAISDLTFGYTSIGSIDPNLLYAGTGEGYFNGDAVRGAGVFKSTDGGATWTQLANTNNSNFHYVNQIVTTPNDADTVYAATRQGVFKSTDGGANWSQMLANNGSGVGSGGTEVTSTTGITDMILIDNSGQDLLVAGNGSIDTVDGIYRSTDGGTTWARVMFEAGMGRSSLAFAPSNPSIMYAMVSDLNNSYQLKNVYRSSNSGATWTATISGSFNATNPSWLLLTNPVFANLAPCGFGSNQILGQGWYDNVIAVAPHDPDIIFAGGIDLFRSDNGGSSFGIISYWWIDEANPEAAHADQHRVLFDPNWNGTSNTTMYVGNDGGLYKTTNALAAVSSGPNNGICFNGETPTDVVWSRLNNGYQVTQFYHGRPIPGAGAGGSDTYFGGCQDNGTQYGSDTGGPNSWTEINGGDGGYVSFDPDNPSTLFAETTGLSLRRSTDNGGSFSSITSGISENPGNYGFITPFRSDPSNPETIWIGGNQPWYSTNAATGGTVNWVSAGATFGAGATIYAWAIDPNDSNTVFAGTRTDQVFRSTNALAGSPSWTNVTGSITSSNMVISWIEVDPNNSSNVYVTNSRFNSSGRHVYQSTNGGTTWTDISNNLPDIPVHCIRVRPGDSNTLILGTDLGVFASTDGGATWQQNSADVMPNTPVEALEFTDADTIYAFTHGRSAFRGLFSACTGIAITQHPASQSTCGGSVTFTVAATGSDPSYQWKKNGSPIGGQTNATLSLNNVTSSDNGTYTCTISNTCSSVTSNGATLTVSNRSYTTADAALWLQAPDDPDCEDTNDNGIIDVLDLVAFVNQTP